MPDSALDEREQSPDFQTGLYSFPFAAAIISRPQTQLRVSPARLRYWLRVGLTDATFGRGTRGSFVLSFHDLVSLEIVRRFRELGASLQLVRALEVALREREPSLTRPFAHRVFYTDGVDVWAQLKPNDTRVIEILGPRRDQLAWKGPVASFAAEIDYRDNIAASWHLTPWIEIDPKIHFGAPVVGGTSVPVSTIRAGLEVGSPTEVAGWYGLAPEQVAGVKEFIDAA